MITSDAEDRQAQRDLASSILNNFATISGGFPKAPHPNAESTTALHSAHTAASKIRAILVLMASKAPREAYCLSLLSFGFLTAAQETTET